MEDYHGHSCERGMFGLDRDGDGEDGGLVIENLPGFNLEYVWDILEQDTLDREPKWQQDASLVLEKQREMAFLAHYHARYATHNHGQWLAVNRSGDMLARQTHSFHQLTDVLSGMDADFLEIANQRLVILRRVLKNSYILAYYTAEDTGEEDGMQKDLFQYRQEMLEQFTEELSRVSENATSQLDRAKVVNLMGTVEKCLVNLLDDVLNSITLFRDQHVVHRNEGHDNLPCTASKYVSASTAMIIAAHCRCWSLR
jgi:hypothetical protein